MTGGLRVSGKPDTLPKTQAFFENRQPAAAHARGAHVCGLSGVFSDAPVACGRQNAAGRWQRTREAFSFLHDALLFDSFGPPVERPAAFSRAEKGAAMLQKRNHPETVERIDNMG